MKGLSPVITLERNYYKFQEEFEDTKGVIRIRISMKKAIFKNIIVSSYDLQQVNGQKIPKG